MGRFLAVILVMCWGAVAQAQELTGLARVDADGSALRDVEGGTELVLALSQPVPWRVFTLDAPRRLVLDFSVVDWTGLAPDFGASAAVQSVRMGAFRPGWSRMVLHLAAPVQVVEAGMATDQGAAVVTVRLAPVAAETFAAAAGSPDSALFDLPVPTADLVPPHRRQDGTRPVVVVLDPGHGGIDPGAENDGVIEADLMLQFARELREVLLRTGGFEVFLTRDDDIFVPLEMRISLARMAGADVFLSLHADALAEGRARGATVYTLSDTASDICLLYTSPSPRDQRGSRMPSSA